MKILADSSNDLTNVRVYQPKPPEWLPYGSLFFYVKNSKQNIKIYYIWYN
jgi:hypothetical protein